MGLLDRTNYHMITNKDKIKVYRMLEEILKIHSRKAELLEAKS